MRSSTRCGAAIASVISTCRRTRSGSGRRSMPRKAGSPANESDRGSDALTAAPQPATALFFLEAELAAGFLRAAVATAARLGQDRPVRLDLGHVAFFGVFADRIVRVYQCLQGRFEIRPLRPDLRFRTGCRHDIAAGS